VVDAAGRGRGNGNVVAHEHVDDVDPVGEEIGDLPAAEVEIRAPVVELLRIVVTPFQWTEEARPVEIGGL